MKINFGKKQLVIKDIKKLNFLEKFKGLMFSSKEKARVLLFNSRGSIHSFFCFFPFLVLWLVNKNTVVDFKIVSPWKLNINSKKNYSKFLEIPINREYSTIVEFIVGEKFKKTMNL